MNFLGLDKDFQDLDFFGLFFRIWIRFDRDTKMFNFAPLLFLFRRADLFLRCLVCFCRFSDLP